MTKQKMTIEEMLQFLIQGVMESCESRGIEYTYEYRCKVDEAAERLAKAIQELTKEK